MKKNNDLLQQLAKASALPSVTPVSSIPSENERHSSKKEGANKGIWLDGSEIETLAAFRRKIYLNGLDASQNMIIRAAVRDLTHNPRIVEIIRQIKEG
jgi:lipid-binding SYLF domain-containing protein